MNLTAEPRVREENEILHQAEPQFFSLVCGVSVNMFVLESTVTSLKVSKHHDRRKQSDSHKSIQIVPMIAYIIYNLDDA